MNFIEFKSRFFDFGCISIDQIYAFQPDFNPNNLTRWIKKNLIIRLRQGLYSFPEYRSKPDFHLWFANKIYKPSYVSLFSALAFHGIIPEAVLQITSVTSLKTNFFSNEAGVWSYKSVRQKLMFGYVDVPLGDGRSFHIATPEKALLDLLYLYSFYDSLDEMHNLRLDTDWLNEDLNRERMDAYLSLFESRVLRKRMKLLFKAYAL